MRPALPAAFLTTPLAHRGYHGMAMPTWERKLRVINEWIVNFVLRRDTVAIEAQVNPRGAFEEFAARPKA